MDKQDKSRSDLKDLRKTFTLDESTLKEINTFKGIHKSKSVSEALRGLIVEYKTLKEHNGVENSLKVKETNEKTQENINNSVKSLNGNRFECNKLCRKFRGCVSSTIFELGEVIANNCYISKYPYEWTTPDGRTVRVCKYMIFPNGFSHDAKNPYPKCIAKQKDITIQLPQDRIIRNPEICWICYKDQKKAKEQKLVKKAVRQPYRGQPKVYYPNEGAIFPSGW